MVLAKRLSPMSFEIDPKSLVKLLKKSYKELGSEGGGAVSRLATPGGGGHCVGAGSGGPGAVGAGLGAAGAAGAGIAEQKVAKAREAKAARIKERMVDR